MIFTFYGIVKRTNLKALLYDKTTKRLYLYHSKDEAYRKLNKLDNYYELTVEEFECDMFHITGEYQ